MTLPRATGGFDCREVEERKRWWWGEDDALCAFRGRVN